MTATILPFRTRPLPPIGYAPPHRAAAGFSLPVACGMSFAIAATVLAFAFHDHMWLWLTGLPLYGLLLGVFIRAGS